MRNGPTSLYRLHDAQGGLLCVGIAGNPAAVPRARRHQSVVGQVGWINVEHYETRSEAEAAETKAIRTERPEYNVAQVTDPLSGLPRISSVFTGLVYGNPHVWTIIASALPWPTARSCSCQGPSSPGTHLRTSPALSYLYPPVFAAAAFVVALEIWQRSVEQKPTLPYWGVLVLLLGYTVPVGIWGDSPAFGRKTTLGEVFVVGWLILQQLVKAFAFLSLLHDLPWQDQRQEPRPSTLRERLRGLRGQATSRP